MNAANPSHFLPPADDFRTTTWFGHLLGDVVDPTPAPVRPAPHTGRPQPSSRVTPPAVNPPLADPALQAWTHRQRRLAEYAGKRVLLLQGPMGPFFQGLSTELRALGSKVFKVNFNGGDWWFYRRDAIPFRGHLDEWPAFLYDLLVRERIDAVMLFGDCRPIHVVARRVATQLRRDVRVFEEGYLRPCYITMDRFGVNGWTSLPDASGFYAALPLDEQHRPMALGPTFWATARYAVQYALAHALGRPWFKAYQHHRSLGGTELAAWLRGGWRKWACRRRESGVAERLAGPLHKRYFLVPLQVASDSQIQFHSPFDSVAQFIDEVVESFAQHADAADHLVVKHHPMDRGHHDYRGQLDTLAHRYQLGDRLIYMHDQNLPSLLKGAAGVVVINSTVGMSALHFSAPVKVCGSAVYNLRGLTYQGALDTFWRAARAHKPDKLLLSKFRSYVIEHTQLVGSFYKPLPKPQASGESPLR